MKITFYVPSRQLTIELAGSAFLVWDRTPASGRLLGTYPSDNPAAMLAAHHINPEETTWH